MTDPKVKEALLALCDVQRDFLGVLERMQLKIEELESRLNEVHPQWNEHVLKGKP